MHIYMQYTARGLNFAGLLILEISCIWDNSRNHFIENFVTWNFSCNPTQIREQISTKFENTAFRQNWHYTLHALYTSLNDMLLILICSRMRCKQSSLLCVVKMLSTKSQLTGISMFQPS